MGRKQRRKQKREQVREGVQRPAVKVKAMDVFRAQDAASKAAVKAIMRAGTADGYENCISKLGLNEDNALSAGTYDFDLVTRNRLLLEMAYRGSWICGQVIDCVAQDMTREGIAVTTSEAEQKLPDFKASFTRKQISQSLCAGIQWGRLYGGAIGIMDIDGQSLATPLRIDTVGKWQFKGIMVYDRWMLNPVLDPIIPDGPDAGLPVFYQIVSSLDSGTPSAAVGGDMYVHHSRIFRFGGIKLPFFQAITEQMWDESVLERLWDRLIMFDNASLSTGQLFDRANLRTVKINGLREIASSGGEALDGLSAQFELMRRAQTNEGLTLLDTEDEFDSTQYTFAGIPETLLQLGQQLSGASQIPLVRLFGQSPAGLNATGESDIRLYYDGIKAKQEANLRQPMSKLIRIMWRSEFGSPPPRDLDFTFVPLWQTDAMDKAEIGSKNTATITQAHQDGLLTTPAAMKELRAQAPQTGLFGNISDEDILEAELEPAPLPDAAPLGPEKNSESTKPVDKSEQVPEGVRETGDAGNFKEGDHPRAKNGEFSSGGGGGSSGGSSSGGKGGKEGGGGSGSGGGKPSVESLQSAGKKLHISGMEKSKQDEYASVSRQGSGTFNEKTGKYEMKEYAVPIAYIHFHDPKGEYVEKVGGENDNDASEFVSQEKEKHLQKRVEAWLKQEGIEDVTVSFSLGEKGGFAVVLKPANLAPYEVEKKKTGDSAPRRRRWW